MTFEDYCQKRKDPGWSFGFVDFRLAAVAVLGPHAWAWYRVRLGLLVAFPTVLLVWISVHAGWHYLIWIPYFFWITLISGTGFSLIDMLRAYHSRSPLRYPVFHRGLGQDIGVGCFCGLCLDSLGEHI